MGCCDAWCHSCSSFLKLHNGGTIHVQDKGFTIVTILNECSEYTVYLVRLNQGTLYSALDTTDINEMSNMYTLKRVRFNNFKMSYLDNNASNDDDDDDDDDDDGDSLLREVDDYGVNEIKACQALQDESNIIKLLSYQVNYENIPSPRKSFWDFFSSGENRQSSNATPLLTSMSFTDLVFPYTCTLQDVINNGIVAPNRYSLTNEQVVKIMKDILKGLQTVHSKGYSYNNLNPNSVVFDFKGNNMDFDLDKPAKLSDLSLVVKQPFHWNSQYIKYINEFNLPYSSPELVEANSLARKKSSRSPSPHGSEFSLHDGGGTASTVGGFANDVWSLGCLLYCILYGMNPFERQQQIVGSVSLEEVIGRVEYTFPFEQTSDSIHQGTTHEALNSVIKATLVKDPLSRKTIGELIDVFEHMGH